MAEPAPRPNRGLLIKLAVAGVVVLVGVALVARGLDLKGLLASGLELIRDAGPVAFFTAMVLLPAVGAPLLAFLLTAGPVFGPTLGIGVVIALVLVAIGLNMALSYFLARRALRPLLEKLFVRLGYRLPRVEAGDVFDLVVILRLTPGIPFPVQNYLLGLAEVPFGKYLLTSAVCIAPGATAFVVFGDAMLHGKGRVALVALGLILALAAATQLVRKHYGRKRA
jgi:uncharacterized membrane protein YdjX (TVP38/TMEM64 family)